MAKSILNVVMQGASGKIGKTLVFRQLRDGQTVIANRGKARTGPLTPAQALHQEKFRRASYLAKRLVQDPMFGPQYTAKVLPGQSAYTVAMTDCLTPPQIKEIGLEEYNGTVGNVISVQVIDDFMVTAVKVRILQSDDTLIEEGSATLDEHGLDWNYIATSDNPSLAGTKIEVTASDIPGNEIVEVATID